MFSTPATMPTHPTPDPIAPVLMIAHPAIRLPAPVNELPRALRPLSTAQGVSRQSDQRHVEHHPGACRRSVTEPGRDADYERDGHSRC